MTRAHDLTHPLTDGVPVYPGTPAPRFTTVGTVDTDGALMTDLHLWSHVGTHVDAPSHMIDGAPGTFDLPIHTWMGPAIVLHVAHPGAAPIEVASLTGVVRGEGVLIGTGHAEHWGSERYYGAAPYLSAAAAEHLRDSGARFVGLDLPSPDPVGAPDQPAHQALLGAGIPVVENLTGVTALPGRVWFCAAPLRAGAGDGGPCRAFALDDPPAHRPPDDTDSRREETP